MLQDKSLRENLVYLLRRTADSKRLVQKFSLGRGDADDLIALCKTIRIMQEIVTLITDQSGAQVGQSDSTILSNATNVEPAKGSPCIELLISRLDLDGPRLLADRIAAAIDEEGVTRLHQVEELEAEAVASLAQSVETGLDPGEESDAVPKRGRKKSEPKSDKRNESVDLGDVWVMRKEYVADERRHYQLLTNMWPLVQARFWSGCMRHCSHWAMKRETLR